ncbi:tRNA-specific adenosine deaminase [filamentous cyanobacterium CCP1]|nr:tRNA-specific adenosine deaminase [filamentous cyanobacterium CCP2]PSB62146.1 tRNA-specific adenosine deaminase [filamentous cyanobacterium CCP1]
MALPSIPPPFIDHPEYLKHYHWMKQAIELAESAGAAGEVPVGAVIVNAENEPIAVGENRRERDHDPTAHAEVVALRSAGKTLGTWHLEQCTLYVTLEPCPMCAGAIVLSRLGKLVYGADDPKAGAIRTVANLPDSPCSNHRLPVVGGILEATCRQQLQDWFRQRRG